MGAQCQAQYVAFSDPLSMEHFVDRFLCLRLGLDPIVHVYAVER